MIVCVLCRDPNTRSSSTVKKLTPDTGHRNYYILYQGTSREVECNGGSIMRKRRWREDRERGSNERPDWLERWWLGRKKKAMQIRKESGLDEKKGNEKKRRENLAARTNSSSSDENANLHPSCLSPFIPLSSLPFSLSVRRMMCSSQAVSSCNVDVSLSRARPRLVCVLVFA